MLKQLGVLFKDQHKVISTRLSLVLEQKSRALEDRAYMRQLMHDSEESGISDWHFIPDDIGCALEKFAIPNILDTNTWQHFEQRDSTSAKTEDAT